MYCNVAGSGPTFPVAARVAERYRTWLSSVGMFSHVGYDAYNAALDETRADIAAFVGDPGGAAHVALTQSATDGLNTLIGGMKLPFRMPRRPGALIVTTAEEHGSALMPTFQRRIRGDRVRVIAHRDDASFLCELRTLFAGEASALVISLVSCKSGKVLPVAEAARIAHASGGLVIVDCAQAAGVIAIDVHALGADAYAFLGYKWLHGPLGVGALWVRDLDRFEVLRLGWRSQTAMDLEGNITLRTDAARFETGTVDAGAYVGLRQTLAVHRTPAGAVAGPPAVAVTLAAGAGLLAAVLARRVSGRNPGGPSGISAGPVAGPGVPAVGGGRRGGRASDGFADRDRCLAN